MSHVASENKGAPPRGVSIDLDNLLRCVVDANASDVHLKVGQPPIVTLRRPARAARGLARCSGRGARGDARARSAPPPARLAAFERHGRARHRLPAARPAALPRQRVPPARRHLVRLPRDPARGARLREPAPAARRPALAEEHHGLVLVTGATGAGKTTTLAAMVGHINRTRRQHIVTIEDPIEILHDDEQLHRQPARGRARHRVVPRGAPARAAPGPGRRS